MDYKQAFKKAVQLQTNEDSNVHSDDLVLLDETENYWIVKNTGAHDDQRETLNVVWKNDETPMESIEL